MGRDHGEGKLCLLNFPAALVGRWRSDEDDALSEYNMWVERGSVKVIGSDYLDHKQCSELSTIAHLD